MVCRGLTGAGWKLRDSLKGGKFVVIVGIMLLACISEPQHCCYRGVAECKPRLTEYSEELLSVFSLNLCYFEAPSRRILLVCCYIYFI